MASGVGVIDKDPDPLSFRNPVQPSRNPRHPCHPAGRDLGGNLQRLGDAHRGQDVIKIMEADQGAGNLQLAAGVTISARIPSRSTENRSG